MSDCDPCAEDFELPGYFYVEDSYDAADDLAEHTCPSPVDYDSEDNWSDLERFEYFNDIEYDSDGFNDVERMVKPQTELKEAGEKTLKTGDARRVSQAKSPVPVICWQSQESRLSTAERDYEPGASANKSLDIFNDWAQIFDEPSGFLEPLSCSIQIKSEVVINGNNNVVAFPDLVVFNGDNNIVTTPERVVVNGANSIVSTPERVVINGDDMVITPRQLQQLRDGTRLSEPLSLLEKEWSEEDEDRFTEDLMSDENEANDDTEDTAKALKDALQQQIMAENADAITHAANQMANGEHAATDHLVDELLNGMLDGIFNRKRKAEDEADEEYSVPAAKRPALS